MPKVYLIGAETFEVIISFFMTLYHFTQLKILKLTGNKIKSNIDYTMNHHKTLGGWLFDSYLSNEIGNKSVSLILKS